MPGKDPHTSRCVGDESHRASLTRLTPHLFLDPPKLVGDGAELTIACSSAESVRMRARWEMAKYFAFVAECSLTPNGGQSELLAHSDAAHPSESGQPSLPFHFPGIFFRTTVDVVVIYIGRDMTTILTRQKETRPWITIADDCTLAETEIPQRSPAGSSKTRPVKEGENSRTQTNENEIMREAWQSAVNHQPQDLASRINFS